MAEFDSSKTDLNAATSAASQIENAAPDVPDDKPLVARCQQGDTAAFDELITRHRNRAFAMMYQMTRNDEDAWDLTQDAFVKAWKNIGRFRGESAFYTWLYRILMNVGLDWLRRKQVKGDAEFDDTIGLKNVAAGATTAPRKDLEPAEKIADAEIRKRVDAAILKLTPDHRAVIVMRELDGMDYQEIADTVGCTLGTVMSRLFYARKKLQTLLRDVYEQL